MNQLWDQFNKFEKHQAYQYNTEPFQIKLLPNEFDMVFYSHVTFIILFIMILMSQILIRLTTGIYPKQAMGWRKQVQPILELQTLFVFGHCLVQHDKDSVTLVLVQTLIEFNFLQLAQGQEICNLTLLILEQAIRFQTLQHFDPQDWRHQVMLLRNLTLFCGTYLLERLFTCLKVRGNLGSLALLSYCSLFPDIVYGRMQFLLLFTTYGLIAIYGHYSKYSYGDCTWQIKTVRKYFTEAGSDYVSFQIQQRLHRTMKDSDIEMAFKVQSLLKEDDERLRCHTLNLYLRQFRCPLQHSKSQSVDVEEFALNFKPFQSYLHSEINFLYGQFITDHRLQQLSSKWNSFKLDLKIQKNNKNKTM